MNFGQAIEALKQGKKVTRKGWNGKGMFLWLKPATELKSDFLRDPVLKQVVEDNGGTMNALGTVCMKTADNKVLTGWLASQTDMLSEDWEVIDGGGYQVTNEINDEYNNFEEINKCIEDWQGQNTETRGIIMIAIEKKNEEKSTLSCIIRGKTALLADGFDAAVSDERCDLMKIMKAGMVRSIVKKLGSLKDN